MIQLPEAMVVTAAVFAAVVATGLIIVLGGLALRLLRLPADPMLEPPTPAVVPPGDPAAARARAALWFAAAERVRRVAALSASVTESDELLRWITGCDPARGGPGRAALAEARAAVEAAHQACKADDEAALAAAERAGRAAVGRVQALAEGLPDFAAEERRKLLWLVAALLVSLLLAGLSLCLR